MSRQGTRAYRRQQERQAKQRQQQSGCQTATYTFPLELTPEQDRIMSALMNSKDECQRILSALTSAGATDQEALFGLIHGLMETIHERGHDPILMLMSAIVGSTDQLDEVASTMTQMCAKKKAEDAVNPLAP